MVADPAPIVAGEQLRAEVERAADLLEQAFAPNTRRAYASSWRAFGAWCGARGLDPERATAEILVTYLSSRLEKGLSVRAAVRAYSGIASKLREIQPEGPWGARSRHELVRRLLRGAGRAYGRPTRKKRPLLPEHFAQLADPARFDASRWVQSARDRALLLFGFAGGFRRSELVGLDVGDLELGPEGAIALVRRSKTDQAGHGAHVAVLRQFVGEPAARRPSSTCPVVALEVYLRGARITEGPVFRAMHRGQLLTRRLCDKVVARIVKDAVASIGLDPAEYGGHSLRCGFVTAASAAGAGIDEIMNTTRHKSYEQVREYIRRASPFDRNASKGLLEHDQPGEPHADAEEDHHRQQPAQRDKT